MAAAWSSGANMPTAHDTLSGCGVWNGALSVAANDTRIYNSTSWSSSYANSFSAYGSGLVGTVSAAWRFAGSNMGGSIYSTTETFNGSSWASSGAYITATWMLGGAGTRTAALGFGGVNSSGTPISNACTFNGTTTSSVSSLPAPLGSVTGAGSQTNALSISGKTTGSVTAACYKYNGSSWASTGSMNQGREYTSSGAGVSASDAIVSGGYAGSLVAPSVETFNGSTWSAAPGLLLNRSRNAGAGASGSNYLTYGGRDAANNTLTSTECFNDKFPDPFSFVGQVDVQPSTLITSNVVTPTDFNVEVSWSCSAGVSASINGGGWTSSGTIGPGQTVQLRMTSSALYSTTTTGTLNINGTIGSWSVTTRNAPIHQVILI